MMQCFLLYFPPHLPSAGSPWDFVAVVFFFSFGSEDGSLESPGFDHDQGNLWSLSRYRPPVEEGGTFRVPLAYGKFTKLGVGLSIVTHQGPTHPSIPLGTLTLNQSSFKGSPVLRSLFLRPAGRTPPTIQVPEGCPRTLLPTSQGGGFPNRAQACGLTWAEPGHPGKSKSRMAGPSRPPSIRKPFCTTTRSRDIF